MTIQVLTALAEVINNALITFQGDTASETIVHRIQSDIDESLRAILTGWNTERFYYYCAPELYEPEEEYRPRPETV